MPGVRALGSRLLGDPCPAPEARLYPGSWRSTAPTGPGSWKCGSLRGLFAAAAFSAADGRVAVSTPVRPSGLRPGCPGIRGRAGSRSSGPQPAAEGPRGRRAARVKRGPLAGSPRRPARLGKTGSDSSWGGGVPEAVAAGETGAWWKSQAWVASCSFLAPYVRA